MPSKTRGKLSKREYAAAQKAKAAPKVAVKTTSKPVSKGIGPVASGDQYAAMLGKSSTNIGPVASGDAYASMIESTRSKASKASSKSSSPKKTNVYQSPTNPDASVANPYRIGETITMTPSTSRGSAVGNIYTKTAKGAKMVSPWLAGLEAIVKNMTPGFDVSDMLGIKTARADGFSVPMNDQGEVLGVEDSRIVSDYIDKNGSLPQDSAQIFQDAKVSEQSRNIFDESGFSEAAKYQRENSGPVYRDTTTQPSNTRTQSSNTRTPRQIAGGDVYNSPQQYSPMPSVAPEARSNPDYTPVDNGQPGTNRRFLGNGYLSNGMASNGKGDYGIQGTMGSQSPDQMGLLDEVLTTLGIKPMTAQAQEMPQTPQDFSAYTPDYMRANTSPVPGISDQSMYNTNNGVPTWKPSVQNIQRGGGSGNQGGGVAQQYAQGATGGDPMDGYYKSQMKSQNKAFSAQEKAQKKALNELLKSIASQYGAQKSTGIDQLAKSKQEDLLKLSGLFQSANQDTDSEQRIQYEQRANQDYAGQQGDFLAKLAAAQAQAESQARSGYQTQMSDIAGKRNDARSKIEELIFKARQDAQKSSGRALSGTAAGSTTYWGENSNGEPVYRNNQTGQLEVGSGLTRKSQDPYAQMIASYMGNQQQPTQQSTDSDGNPIFFNQSTGQWEYR